MKGNVLYVSLCFFVDYILLQVTLDSGINVGPTFIYFENF